MIRTAPIAFMLAAIAPPAQAEDFSLTPSAVAELPYLAALRGTDPHLLLEDDRVIPSLTKTFSQSKIEQLRATTLTKIETFGWHLVFSGYLAGSEFDNGAVVFINLGDGSVQACWSEGGADTWLAPHSPPRPLGRNVCINDAESVLVKLLPLTHGALQMRARDDAGCRADITCRTLLMRFSKDPVLPCSSRRSESLCDRYR